MKKTPGTNVCLDPIKIGKFYLFIYLFIYFIYKFYLFILYFQLTKNREILYSIKLAPRQYSAI